MLIKEKKNTGFTLVEVIVSMLVLSITIVSVLSAFTIAAKSNARTKKAQEAESLLGDVLEYTKAKSRQLDPTKGMDALGLYGDFGGSLSVSTPFSGTNDIEEVLISGVKEGFHRFNIKITRDRKPAKYSSGGNAHKSITFGETGSKTAVINTNFAEYDENARDEFLLLYKEAVEQHNMEVDQALAADPNYSEKVKINLPENEESLKEIIRTKLSREIWLETQISQSNSNKVKLMAYMVYTVADDLLMPVGAERQIETTIFESEEYDLSTNPDTAAEKLKQVYVLYTPSSEAKKVSDVDIRILDKANQLDANVFLAYQQSLVELNNAVSKDLVDRYQHSEQIKVSFVDSSGLLSMPRKVGLYCSAGLNVIGNTPSSVKTEEKSLVASSEGIRIVTIDVEIIDAKDGTVLSKTKEPVACLQ